MYLLLNAVISACATATVLYVYDRFYRPSTVPSLVSSSADGDAILEISTVVGAGLPSTETVLLRNTGSARADLQGWTMQDADGNVYRFPAATVLPGGAIQLHTAPGTDTSIDLYWGLTASVWSSGETASLLDPAGAVKSVYKVP